MKRLTTLLLIILSATAFAQQQDTAAKKTVMHHVYVRHSVQAVITLGFIDGYKNDNSVPVGFEKNTPSGYRNINAKIDYALSRQVSLAAAVGYDAFDYNFAQLYTGYTGIIRRYKVSDFRMFSLGLTAYYHLDKIIRVRHLDPFVGLGIALNNQRYSAYPQGDSTVVKIDHTVTPYLKAGVHYYISDRFSVYGDVGYEKQSIVNLGFACRFFAKNKIITK